MKKCLLFVVIVALAVCLVGCVQQPVSMEGFDMLQAALNLIDSDYLGELDIDKADYLAASAVLNGLDDYTYLKDYQIASAASASLGMMTLNTRYNDHFVDYVYPNTPADHTFEDGFHLMRGDEIYAVNGQRVRGLSSSYMSEYMAGDAGTELCLSIWRDGKYVGDYTYVKASQYLPRAFYIADLYEDGTNVGYIHLNDFSQVKTEDGKVHRASDDFAVCMDRAAADGVKKLVLDLRNNGGGSTDILSEIASYFVPLDEGKPRNIMQLEYQKTGEKWNVSVSLDNYVEGLELVIICNGNTASAAECLIGACRAFHPNTTVIGQPTHGKGVFQQSSVPIEDHTRFNEDTFPDQYYVVLVSGYYYIFDPAVEGGRYCIHENPLQPDYVTADEETVGKLWQDAELLKAKELLFSENE